METSHPHAGRQVVFPTPTAYTDGSLLPDYRVINLHTILTGLISGLGLSVATLYLIGRLRQKDDSQDRALWAKLDMPEAYDRRRRRRALSMAIMALISVVFFIGANYLDPKPHPHVALLFWVVLLILLIWLCALAMIDLAEIRKLRTRLPLAARKLFYEEMGRCQAPTHVADDEEDRTV